MQDHIDKLSLLFQNTFNESPLSVNLIPESGSARLYFRLVGTVKSVLGTYNSDIQENRAFFYLAKHFADKGLNVPRVYAISTSEQYYLQTDLGSVSLFDIITKPSIFPNYNLELLLEKAITHLVAFQVKGAENLNIAKCYPIPMFDRNSIFWDLNYFKYCFLKPSGVPVNEVLLEAEFNHLADVLLSHDLTFFHYRDFQSRNIMVNSDDVFFIDFQGGRLGPCLYDVASFLYQAKAGFSPKTRERLFNLYIGELAKYRTVDKSVLKHQFPVVVMFRILQTLGAYGFRGFFERKTHFIQSIPYAINNFLELVDDELTKEYPYIVGLLRTYAKTLQQEIVSEKNIEGLTISISSFSFKKGYPKIHPEHGGGFVFDCRSLPNPGRIDKYKSLTGLDQDVILYLENSFEVEQFNERVFDIISSSVKNYLERNFKHLSVAFGCTGGQHRSVYCANILAKKLSASYSVNIIVKHQEIQKNTNDVIEKV